MNFTDLETEIEKVLEFTFLEKIEIEEAYFDPGDQDQYSIWYFLYKDGNYHTVFELPENIAAAQLHTITDVEKFKKKFPSADKMAYLIFKKKVVNKSYNLDVYQSYRLMEALKKVGVEMIEFSFLAEIKPGGNKATERSFCESDIQLLMNKVHKITGDGDVMKEFNSLLGISAG